MYKKKKFPLQLFIFFENIEFFFWTSSVVKNNHFFCLIKKNFFFCMLTILKNELFLNRSSLIEASAIDLSLYSNLSKQNFFFFLKQKKFLCFFSFYLYFLKQRITILTYIEKSLISIENLFSNGCWLEREISEMYGIFFLKKKDTRNLLLDYGVLENPLLKNFPCIGKEEVIFNSLKENITYNFINAIEL